MKPNIIHTKLICAFRYLLSLSELTLKWMDTVNDIFEIWFSFIIHKMFNKIFNNHATESTQCSPPPHPFKTWRTDIKKNKTFFLGLFFHSCGYLLLDKLYHIFFIFPIILLLQLVGHTKALIPSPKYIFKKCKLFCFQFCFLSYLFIFFYSFSYSQCAIWNRFKVKNTKYYKKSYFLKQSFFMTHNILNLFLSPAMSENLFFCTVF